MRNKVNINFEDMHHMREIAQIYKIINNKEKSKQYHENIVKICDQYTKKEKMLECKIRLLKPLEKPCKPLKTTAELPNLNPENMILLPNIETYLKEVADV